MCGICGILGIEPREKAEAATRRMLAAIHHRGPDEEGLLLAPPLAAGTRRLSIIDLPGGSQPIWNETEALAVIFNGEIYNFRELRRELESLGHRFRTRSDTEVIVHAYEAWGEKCLERLQGMFALAVIEFPRGKKAPPERVFLARDRLGIKPLYYALADGAMVFASEVRAILASGLIAPRLSEEALPSYLLFGSVCEPMTLVEGVFSIPPGHSLSVSLTQRISAVLPMRWWGVSRAGTGNKLGASANGGSLAARVRELLEAAARSHLMADVPVGIFLSSGLDSTALAALASRAQGGIHTFTVAFPDLEFSEADLARRTAERLGTEHRELTLSDNDLTSRLDDAVAAFDQPSMDGINTYFVSWAARQAGLKVALSGLGSDELFGGYTSFRATVPMTRLAGAAKTIPSTLRASLAAPIRTLALRRYSPDAQRKALAAWLDPSSFPHPYFFTRALFTPQVALRWLHENGATWRETPWARWLTRTAQETASMDSFTGISWLELRSYLANTLLRDTDCMSMCHSLEVRVPFLDTPLVEYLLALPESVKKNPAQPKSLLIEALGDALPQEIVQQTKRTFTFPWENWLRGSLGKRVAAGLADWAPALESSLRREAGQSVWKDFVAGRTSWSRPWSLYVLNEWAKRNLRSHAAGDPERGSPAAVSVA
ncbi:MAG TPA: asparagine synthase (glutamine-hydrolyzing) [Candidatus Limnocylindrales bacterium]|nr:asparagine synthase (glutamine-hydrolyzing) [Candidatus Limnocylindrales bacterium]